MELADRLISFDDQKHEVSDLSEEECKELDSVAFECCSCNHWFHQRDNATPDGDQWECKECAE